MSKVQVRVSVSVGSGPLDPPVIRVDASSLSFMPKGMALQVAGRDPARVNYQLSLYSSKQLGKVGVRIRNWIRDHSEVSGCFVQRHSIMLGVRYRADTGFDSWEATEKLLQGLKAFLQIEAFPNRELVFSGPQYMLATEIILPADQHE